MDVVVVRPDSAGFRRLAAALDDEADGREWQRDLAGELGDVLGPGVSAVRSAVLGGQVHGGDHAGESLRTAIADAVHPVVSFVGPDLAGARIAVAKTGMPRRFRTAPNRFNARSFRHQVFGGDPWVTQVGAPGWFDDTLRPMRPHLRRAAEQALRHRAERISRKAPA